MLTVYCMCAYYMQNEFSWKVAMRRTGALCEEMKQEHAATQRSLEKGHACTLSRSCKGGG